MPRARGVALWPGWIEVLREAGGGETVLRVYEALPADLALRGNLPVANYESYGAFGRTQLTSGAFHAGRLTLCRVSKGAGEARRINVCAPLMPRPVLSALDQPQGSGRHRGAARLASQHGSAVE